MMNYKLQTEAEEDAQAWDDKHHLTERLFRSHESNSPEETGLAASS